jgi:hypothetical protein
MPVLLGHSIFCRTPARMLSFFAIVCSLLAPGALSLAAQPFSGSEWPKTDFSRHSVPFAEIMSGGPPKDGIPAVDRPRFSGVSKAAQWLHAAEPVIVLVRGDDARAYPLQIMTYHEIVNDTVDGLPVAVTFCPLCNAAIVFDRRVSGTVLDFGTTGKLRKSDLVMYDRQTESWWQQFTGTGIIGRHTGATLRQIPSAVTSFADFRRSWPKGRVLTRETGFVRPYGRNPYRGYDRIGDMPFLFNDPVDPRLPAMERVLGVSVGNTIRIYPFTTLDRLRIVNDSIGAEPVAVFTVEGMASALDAEIIRDARRVPAAAAYSRRLDTRVLSFEMRGATIVDRETGSEWNIFGHAIAGAHRGRRLNPLDGGVHFAFAWLAFNPGSEIFSADTAAGRRTR